MLAVLALPEVKKRLGDMGFDVIGSSSDVAKQQVEGDMQRWGKLIQSTGIKPD
jgi:tripartite-type tricarboxylate transporter receptor subunit TctC